MEPPVGEDLGRRGQEMVAGLLSPALGGEGFKSGLHYRPA